MYLWHSCIWAHAPPGAVGCVDTNHESDLPRLYIWSVIGATSIALFVVDRYRLYTRTHDTAVQQQCDMPYGDDEYSSFCVCVLWCWLSWHTYQPPNWALNNILWYILGNNIRYCLDYVVLFSSIHLRISNGNWTPYPTAVVPPTLNSTFQQQ